MPLTYLLQFLLELLNFGIVFLYFLSFFQRFVITLNLHLDLLNSSLYLSILTLINLFLV